MNKNKNLKDDGIQTVKDILEVFNKKSFSQLAYDNRRNYQENTPYPHIIFDDFLPLDIAKIISSEYPNLNNTAESFKLHDHEYASRYLLEDTTKFSTNLQLFSNAISSRSFLLFLETLTGIKSLIPDPYFMGGGAMVTNQGGHLNVHVDFNWHQKLQAWRRCNVLFYLTQNWREEYEGKLELWSKDGNKKIKDITPLFNRVVIFNTTSTSYHGQPVKVMCPKDKPRHVFSAFYYASEKNDETDNHPHYTRYKEDKRSDNAVFEDSPYANNITIDYLKDLKK